MLKKSLSNSVISKVLVRYYFEDFLASMLNVKEQIEPKFTNFYLKKAFPAATATKISKVLFRGHTKLLIT